MMHGSINIAGPVPATPRLSPALILGMMLAILLIAFPSLAAAQGSRHIDASIHVSTETPRPGSTSRIAIRMTPESGWHGYWINPGDSGLPVEAVWRAPPGVRIGELQHPAPTLLELAGLASYVHKGAFTLLADLDVPASIPQGARLPIEVDLNWLACSDTLCVPERATLRLDLAAGDGAAGASRALVSAAEAALPRSGAARVTIARQKTNWTFDLTGAQGLDPSNARLFPVDAGWFDAAAPQRVTRGQGGAIQIAVPAAGSAPAGDFSGVVTDGRRSFVLGGAPTIATAGASEPTAEAKEVPASLPNQSESVVSIGPSADTASSVASQEPGNGSALRIALIGAILGGLLLNLMPCVFPILSLKALSLVRSGVDRRAARVEGVAYFAGSVVTTTLLGAILIGARALGHDVGWSFQLQDPRIILILMLLSLAIALNLAGLFEIRGTSLAGGRLAQPGWSGAFGTGALAAIIATPCSGPFLGVALGAALVLPAPATLAVFAGLGIGMALPFLVIAFVPAAQRILPRPGKWMETFRRVLAIPMLLTAIGLAWVLGRQSGVDGLGVGLLLAGLAGVGLWWAGQRQAGGRKAGPALIPVLAPLLIVFAIQMPVPSTAGTQAAPTVSAGRVEPFSEARLTELRSAGTPVFVDMTADWCLICQVNKRVAIDRDDTRAAFARAGVVTLVGDWTRGDPAITRYLASRGRNSIPYYLFVSRDGEERELPQVLSSGLLVEQASTS